MGVIVVPFGKTVARVVVEQDEKGQLKIDGELWNPKVLRMVPMQGFENLHLLLTGANGIVAVMRGALSKNQVQVGGSENGEVKAETNT